MKLAFEQLIRVIRNISLAAAILLSLMTLLDLRGALQDPEQEVVMMVISILASTMIIIVLATAGLCQFLLWALQRLEKRKRLGYDTTRVADPWVGHRPDQRRADSEMIIKANLGLSRERWLD